MLTCKEASYLASKKLDSELTWRERMGLSLHLTMCKLCRRYIRDVKQFQAFLRRTTKTGQSMWPETVKLPEQSRKRITQALNEALQKTKQK
jgi:predicted anti-sigma-YlaC factor YlaD